MTLPTFETDRLLLRPRSLSDTPACLAMDREPEVTRFVRGPWEDPKAHRAFIEGRTRGPYPPGLGYWAVARRERPDSFLGWILLIPSDAVGPEVEIGWRLGRAAWGQGVATEAAREILRHGFETARLERVIAEIDVANAASVRVAEKLGLRRGAQANGACRFELASAGWAGTGETPVPVGPRA
jgi:RimJ/RimL family protein N-acetyltransferase